jgi:RHS repeat-associated protein
MTRYAHDPQTFRLVRLRSERCTRPDPLTYGPGAVLQDFAYAYDLAGNIAAIRDRAPGCGIPNSVLGADALDRSFAYDPLYRLLSASGRECDAMPAEPWDGRPRGNDLSRTRGWTERYQYDACGNLTRLLHQTEAGGFVRRLALSSDSNRLARITVDHTAYDLAYDPNGNLMGEATSRHFEWDHADRLRVYRTHAAGAEPSVFAHYLHDAGGQRVKKLVRKQGGRIETTVCIDGVFEHHRIVHAGTTRQNNTLHVMDGRSRVGVVRVGAPFPDDGAPAVQFHLGDHLGSSHVVVDDGAQWISREEYTPYGETSFGGFARKRYRFTGKERDEESGLNYHGARYCAPWLGRWISCDPAGAVDGANLYAYARNNPMRFSDPSGLESYEQITAKTIELTGELTRAQQRYQTSFGHFLSRIPQINRLPGAQKLPFAHAMLDDLNSAFDAYLTQVNLLRDQATYIDELIDDFAKAGGSQVKVDMLREGLREAEALLPKTGTMWRAAGELQRIGNQLTEIEGRAAGGSGGAGSGGSTVRSPSRWGTFFKWLDIALTADAVVNDVSEGSYAHAGLEIASLFVWQIGVAMAFYDIIIVPAANASEPPSAAAQCINAHHRAAFEEKPKALDTSSDALLNSLEQERLQAKKKEGPLSLADDLLLKRLQTHGASPFDARSPFTADPFSRAAQP